jgi:hypothetical protein
VTTFETASKWLTRAKDRDKRRGFTIDKKRVVIAYTAELVIVVASLWGAWLFANMYGENQNQITMMILAPIGYAVIEFCRVPLAISARAHGSVFVRIVALIGVICASGVTIKSMSQLGEIMFRPRLFEVVHTKEALDKAKAAQASAVQQLQDADALIGARRAAFVEDEQRVKSAAQELAALPKDQCSPAIWYKDGEQHKGQTCKSDPRIASLQINLKAAQADRDAAAKALEQAVATRKVLDRTRVDRDVAMAQESYREALLHSQLHSFTGMVFGIGPTEVTDGQINQFLRLFVFFPAIFVAFASSFVAFTAVHHLKPELIPFALDGADYLLNPTYQAVLNDAIERVAATHRRDTEKIGEVA